jgi:hypothetical protein
MNQFFAIALLLLITTPSYSQSQEIPSYQIVRLEKESTAIVGVWRGFREENDFLMYYGYEFRSNGSFFARHRVYRKGETIKDEIWQGQWQLKNNLVWLQGANTNNNKRTVRMRFRLEDDNRLYYDGGSLPRPYIPQQLGKQGQMRV